MLASQAAREDFDRGLSHQSIAYEQVSICLRSLDFTADNGALFPA